MMGIMGNFGYDGKFLLEMGESQEWGVVGFIVGGWDIFMKSLDIVYRGMLTPLFYEDVPLLPIPPFSNVAHTPSPTPTSLSLQTLPPLHCSFCCQVFLAEWVNTPHLMCYFTQR